MATSTNLQNVKQPFTSDGSLRDNKMTRDEFLRRVLYSGEVTRVGQHLALVIFLIAEGQNQLRLSVRQLEAITGWSRQTISDHLSELEVFMRITFGSGRAKTLFELQGVIEDALASAVVSGSLAPPKLTRKLVAKEPDTSVVASQIDTTPFVASQVATRSLVASQVVTSFLASQIATTAVMASQPDAIPPQRPVAVSQVDAKSVVASQIDATASIERERESNNSISFSLSSLSHSTPRAEETTDDIQLNGVAILGPNFKVPYGAIDQAAALIGMSKDRARAIAEICARDWAANGVKPQSPMAVIKRAMKNDVNEGQIHDVRLGKARAMGPPAQTPSASSKGTPLHSPEYLERVRRLTSK